MKKTVLLFMLLSLITLASSANTLQQQKDTVKKDTARKSATRPKPTVVKGRKARMQLQLEQIKRHKKEWKKLDSLQKRLDKERNKSSY
jgi:hypothetical protein